MNLSKLFDMQRELDAKIIKEKGLEDMDRLPYLILALQVELGECANEWRGFKFWSNNRKPNTDAPIDNNRDTMTRKNPLLEEYVDCLHFILSIGLLLDLPTDHEYYTYGELSEGETIITQFQTCFNDIASYDMDGDEFYITELIRDFTSLGIILGFTEEQIFEAYISKNAVNHQRQVNGY